MHGLRPMKTLFVILALTALSLSATQFCLNRGYILYYGDAEAHLNIARRILDSKTPGPEQLGTAWLPLPHLVMLPFVTRDGLWKSGLAGSMPSMVSFIVAGTFLFLAALRAFSSALSAAAALVIFALNPNTLYLQSTPMTEPLFAAAFAVLLWSTLWFRDTQSLRAVVIAAIASTAASLTRYEGWFLIPFVTLYFLVARPSMAARRIPRRRFLAAATFAALASLAPLAWLAYNWYYYGNPLEFYDGPWSAIAIYKRALDGGMQPYPGDHDWRAALEYYFAAARLVSGWPVLIAGAAGIFGALYKRAIWPIAFLALPIMFYLWSMHGSGTPIFVPTLWPHSYYNTRYAVAILPLAAFAIAGLMPAKHPRTLTWGLAGGIALLLALTSFVSPAITWKESEQNSLSRRAWIAQAAAYLAENYRHEGILAHFGDLTGVLRQSGIPLGESLHEGNGAAWTAAVTRPDLFLQSEWILGFAGDDATTAALRAGRRGRHYQLMNRIIVKGAPVVEIWKRQ